MHFRCARCGASGDNGGAEKQAGGPQGRQPCPAGTRCSSRAPTSAGLPLLAAAIPAAGPPPPALLAVQAEQPCDRQATIQAPELPGKRSVACSAAPRPPQVLHVAATTAASSPKRPGSKKVPRHLPASSLARVPRRRLPWQAREGAAAMQAPGGPLSNPARLAPTPAQVRAFAQEHGLGNPAAGLFVWSQNDEE